MDNPFRTPASENSAAARSPLQVHVILLLLSVITTWLLTKDIQHLLSIYNKSLTDGATASISHYAYIKAAPLEIAYFRGFSSVAVLALIIFAARNSHALVRYYLFMIAYGFTQLIYQALAISGVTIILSQVAGKSALDTSFWFTPAMAPSTIQVLMNFLLLVAPPVTFLGLCLIAKSQISSTKQID